MQDLLPSSPSIWNEEERGRPLQAVRTKPLSIDDTRLAHAKPNTPEYALVTYDAHCSTASWGTGRKEKRYLALSALTDIRLSITDHASLWNLAELL